MSDPHSGLTITQSILKVGGKDWQSEDVCAADSQLVLFFGPTDRLLNEDVAGSLRQKYPTAIVAGCSTGHVIMDDDIDDHSIVTTAIKFNKCEVKAASVTIADADQSESCGAALAKDLLTDDLRLVLILSQGLNVNGDKLIQGLGSALPEDVQIVGGLAGDGPRFERTLVCLNDKQDSETLVAIGIYGDALGIGQGWAGGWTVFGPQRTITASEGAKLNEIDGQPALDLYVKYLGDEADALPGAALLYPLQIWDPNSNAEPVVRTILSIDEEDRSMTFAGDIPTGWNAQLMVGHQGALVDGAREALANAMQRNPPADICGDRLNLLVSCVGRQLCMQSHTSDEVMEIHRASPHSTKIAGFYSYGEIASHGGAQSTGLLNQTMAVTHLWEHA
jgi:hypothetical protein